LFGLGAAVDKGSQIPQNIPSKCGWGHPAKCGGWG
jgi:hypothetical protein